MNRILTATMMLVLLAGCHQKEPSLKSLNVALASDVQGLDPAAAQDFYTLDVIPQIFEGLYEYEYLARPYTVRPLLADGPPTVSEDRRTYTFSIRPGVRFHDDPAFGGQPRFLKASDVVYSFQRIADPGKKSPNRWVFDGHVKEINAPDEKTVVIRLIEPWPQILFVLAMPALGVVAREVVEKYGDEFLNHPVGTGPFELAEWRRGQKIRLTRNREYWGSRYPTEGSAEDRAKGLLADAGKTLPFVDELTFSIFVEAQPRWLNFLRGNLDVSQIPIEAGKILDRNGDLSSDLKEKGISLDRSSKALVGYIVFNLDDPVIGPNLRLRRAIARAIDREAKIRIVDAGRGVEAVGPIPPGIFGHDPNAKDPDHFDPASARKLMEGVKTTELFFEHASNPYQRHLFELVADDLRKVGILLKPRPWTFPQLLGRIQKRQFQMAYMEWLADYPDPENFLQLFWGENPSPARNRAGFRDAEYDRLFEKVRNMGDGPTRLKLIRRMVEIVRERAPWVFLSHQTDLWVSHAWLNNFKRHQMAPSSYKYLRLDLAEKSRRLKGLR